MAPPPVGFPPTSDRTLRGPPVQTRYEGGNVVFGPRPRAGIAGPPAPPPPSYSGGVRVVPRPPGAPRGFRPYRRKRETETSWTDEDVYDLLTSITIFDRFQDDEEDFPTWLNNFTSRSHDSSGKRREYSRVLPQSGKNPMITCVVPGGSPCFTHYFTIMNM